MFEQLETKTGYVQYFLFVNAKFKIRSLIIARFKLMNFAISYYGNFFKSAAKIVF